MAPDRPYFVILMDASATAMTTSVDTSVKGWARLVEVSAAARLGRRHGFEDVRRELSTEGLRLRIAEQDARGSGFTEGVYRAWLDRI
jgi:hypothetical protein